MNFCPTCKFSSFFLMSVLQHAVAGPFPGEGLHFSLWQRSFKGGSKMRSSIEGHGWLWRARPEGDIVKQLQPQPQASVKLPNLCTQDIHTVRLLCYMLGTATGQLVVPSCNGKLGPQSRIAAVWRNRPPRPCPASCIHTCIKVTMHACCLASQPQ